MSLAETDGEHKNLANAVLAEASRYLAIGVLNAIRFYDPDVVVLGGGLASVLIDRVKMALPTVQWSIHDDRQNVAIVAATCEEPGVQGAAALALQSLTASQAGELTSMLHQRPTVSLRSAKGRDLEALYAVCLHTGDSGKDGAHLFTDLTLLGSIYVGPYLMLSSRFAFCLANTTGKGVGYVLGVLDTKAFDQLCREQWWPSLRARYPLDDLHKYNQLEQELISNQIHSRPPIDTELIQRYPSHMHIDLLPVMQGYGYGVIMVKRLLYALQAAGSTGVHLTMSATNHRAFGFYEKLGFCLVKELRSSGELVLGLLL